MMTAKELVAACLAVTKNYSTVYMWGTFGLPVTESLIVSKSAQYPNWYTAARQAALRAFIGRGYFAFDCVGLIKGLLWGWNGDSAKTYGGAVYASNGVPDTNDEGVIAKCSGVSTDFSTIAPGEAVWLSGHIGVYIGDGKVIECTPSWSNGVQVTACKNIGTISGLNSRTWTKHGKMPWVEYTQEEQEEEMLTDKEIYEACTRHAATLLMPDDCKPEFEEAKAAGITDGTDPTQLMPRWQAVLMAYRAMKK